MVADECPKLFAAVSEPGASVTMQPKRPPVGTATAYRTSGCAQSAFATSSGITVVPSISRRVRSAAADVHVAVTVEQSEIAGVIPAALKPVRSGSTA